MQIGKISNKNLYLILAIILMQILWLIGIWVTGASTNRQMLLGLGIYSLICGGIVLLSLKYINDFDIPFSERIIDNENKIIPLIITVVAIVGIIYAFIQRVWPWDEEYAFIAAQMIANQGVGTFIQNYSEMLWVHNHPPLIFLLNGIAVRVVGDFIIVIRLVSLIFAIGIVVLTYLIGNKLEGKFTGLLAAIFIATFPLFIRLGTAAVLDIQVTFFFALAMYILLLLSERPSYILAIALALAISAGLLTKYTMIFIIPLLAVLFISKRSYWKLTPHFALVGIIVVSIFVAWMFIGDRIGISVPGVSVFDLLRRSGTALAENMEPPTEDIPPGKIERIDFAWYLTSPIGRKFLVSNLGTRLTSAIGPYNLPLIFLGALFVFRRRSSTDAFLMIWILVVIVVLLLTIPDHRYFMPIFPALAILIALWLKNHPVSKWRVTLLSVLYLGAALVLFAGWYRAAELFQR